MLTIKNDQFKNSNQKTGNGIIYMVFLRIKKMT